MSSTHTCGMNPERILGYEEFVPSRSECTLPQHQGRESWKTPKFTDIVIDLYTHGDYLSLPVQWFDQWGTARPSEECHQHKSLAANLQPVVCVCVWVCIWMRCFASACILRLLWYILVAVNIILAYYLFVHSFSHCVVKFISLKYLRL